MKLVHVSELGKLKKSKSKLKETTTNLKKRKCIGTDKSNMFIGACMSMLPKSRCTGFANALGLTGVLENIGIDTTNVNVVECLPQQDTLQNLVTERVCNSLFLVQDSIQKNLYVYLFIDKGNKNVNKNLEKYIAWYNVDWKRVRA